MNPVRPGTLAIRAINQYRRRDVVSYLGLRYYLENSASRTDRWAQDVAVNIVLQRTEGRYFKSLHFKDFVDGEITHRQMYFPGANEALAETALIDACSKSGMLPGSRVFSYRPVSADDRSGIFEHYMVGLKARQEAITEACRRDSEAHVAFFDIKRFYPSVTNEVATRRWIDATEKSSLPAKFRDLGVKLLHDFGLETGESGRSLLTGPMFSHLVGNVVLGEIDRVLERAGAQYFRYVDDIAFVGSKSEILHSSSILRSRLEEIGLHLHDEYSAKTMSITSVEWLQTVIENEVGASSTSWMSFVGKMKQLLIYQPELTKEVGERLASQGFRIPVPDYSGAVRESGYVDRFLSLAKKKWYRSKLTRISSSTIVEEAQALRNRYTTELVGLLGRLRGSQGFASKSILPQVRYRMGRLAYLASNEELGALAEESKQQSELFFQSAVARAVASENVDEIISMGGNASQAVAQPLRMASNRITYSHPAQTEVQRQALAVFAFNGVRVSSTLEEAPDALLAFAMKGADINLMRTEDPFVRELACLHGIADVPRHSSMLDSAFDEAEEIALDAVDQARLSMSL